jgi:hypothetical protein
MSVIVNPPCPALRIVVDGIQATRLAGGGAGPIPERAGYGSFVSFEDPDGNGWLVLEITARLPGPVTDGQRR